MTDNTNDSRGGYAKLSDKMEYDDWEFETSAELRKKGVLSIVLGDEPRPPGSSNHKVVKAWIARRDVAAAEIIRRLDSSQFAHVRGFEEDPEGMWGRLKETHQSSGLGGVVVMWKKFYGLRKSEEHSTMRAHIAAIRGHAEKLGRLYNDKPSDAQIIATILMSLPSTYDTLIVSLDSNAQKDDLDFVIGRLLNEEVRQESEGVVPSLTQSSAWPSASALAAQTRDMSRITCFKCQQKGHYQMNCPQPGPLVPLVPRSTATAPIAAYTESFRF